jgi:hypothetical protein
MKHMIAEATSITILISSYMMLICLTCFICFFILLKNKKIGCA